MKINFYYPYNLTIRSIKNVLLKTIVQINEVVKLLKSQLE